MIIDLLFIILSFTGFISVFLMALYCNLKEPKNKVRFYVKMVEDGMPWLFIQKRNGSLELFAVTDSFTDFGLNPLDFYNMKAGEIKEVFLNTKD